jgi:hypothetical protein
VIDNLGAWGRHWRLPRFAGTSVESGKTVDIHAQGAEGETAVLDLEPAASAAGEEQR